MDGKSKLVVLDGVRGITSLYVALGHWILSNSNNKNYLKVLFSFGQEAVIIFFLLSGFVIHNSWERGKEQSLKGYFLKRARRIYFPFIIALLLSYIIIQPDIFPVKEFVGNVFMLQDFDLGKPGCIVNSFLGNSPLWSLSYEAFFYLFFPFVYPLIKNHKHRVAYIGTISILSMSLYLMFPNHLFLMPAYFIIWWSGLELLNWILFASRSDLQHIKDIIKYILVLVAMLLLVSIFYYTKYKFKHFNIGVYPVLFLRHFSVAAVIIVLIVIWRRCSFKGINIFKPFGSIAPISYSLYVFQYPILVQLDLKDISAPFSVMLKIGTVLIICYAVEIKLQPLINKLIR